VSLRRPAARAATPAAASPTGAWRPLGVARATTGTATHATFTPAPDSVPARRQAGFEMPPGARWDSSARLETRTKESNKCASHIPSRYAAH